MALNLAEKKKLDKLEKKAVQLVADLGSKAKENAELKEKCEKYEELFALQQSVIDADDMKHSEEMKEVLKMFKSIEARLAKLEPKV